MDGAFFPHPDLQVPEEKMGHHACEYVVMPTGILSHLVMIHAQLALGLLEALLNGPAQAAEPHQGAEAHGTLGVADKIAVLGLFAKSAADEQQDGFLRQPVLRKHHPLPGKLIDDRPLGALGDIAPVPEKVVDGSGQLTDADRLAVGIEGDLLGPCLSAPLIDTPDGHRPFGPNLGCLGDLDQIGGVLKGLASFDELGAHAVNRVGKDVAEGQQVFVSQRPEHLGGQLRLGPEDSVGRQIAFLPAFTIGFGKPLLRQKQPFVDQRVAILGDVSGKDADLAVVHLAQVATVLAGYPDGVVSFFGETAFIENQSALGAAEVFVDQIGLVRKKSKFDALVKSRSLNQALL